MDDTAQIDREVNVEFLIKLNVSHALLFISLHFDNELDAFYDRFPVRLLCIEVVHRHKCIYLTIRNVLVIQTRELIEDHLLSGKEEHRRKVALVFVDDDDIYTILNLKVDRIKAGYRDQQRLIKNFWNFIHIFCGIILGPQVTHFCSLLCHLIAQLLHDV